MDDEVVLGVDWGPEIWDFGGGREENKERDWGLGREEKREEEGVFCGWRDSDGLLCLGGC